MPQLWTETFVTQYFWLLAILFTFYYFISTIVIPKIANSVKARQVVEDTNKEEENEQDEVGNVDVFAGIKQNLEISLEKKTWDTVSAEWLLTNPEESSEYWVTEAISPETLEIIQSSDESEETLEEFTKNE